uniref:Uncharacterized protein n=1 Tax=Ditylenchus dipsaci TaxID=166011 RepID=A0A915E6P7_9BILA
MLDIKDCQRLLLTTRLFSRLCLAKIMGQRTHMLTNYQMDLLNEGVILPSSTKNSAALQHVLAGEKQHSEVDLIEAIPKLDTFFAISSDLVISYHAVGKTMRPPATRQLNILCGKRGLERGGPVSSVLEARYARSNTRRMSKQQRFQQRSQKCSSFLPYK